MLNSQEVISHYEALADITNQMLAAARVRDWEQLAALESRCSSHVETLKTQEPGMALPVVAREKKVAIIQQILADDRKIRDITEPWMAQLSMLINSGRTEHKLSKTYGSNHSG